MAKKPEPHLSSTILNPKLLNTKLKVQAVDFRHWQGRCLGIMVTPWFMHLMILPNEGDEWQDMPLGVMTEFDFPSGKYQFHLSEEDGIGRFQVHPVYQPMSLFESQESAIKVAQQALVILMQDAPMKNRVKQLKSYLEV